MMNCPLKDYKTNNPKSLSNHVRWHLGKMEKTRKKFSANKLGSKNPMWRENPKRQGLHEWIRRHKPKPEFCENCRINPPLDLANISQKYYRDVNDFEWLCRKCHMIKDGRIELLKLTQFKREAIFL